MSLSPNRNVRLGHYICAQCGAAMRSDAPLYLAHLDGDATNNDPANLRLVCEACAAANQDAISEVRAVSNGEAGQ